MNLRKKKNLAARILKIGKGRIIFAESRLDEIKESITKQDIRELKQDGAIIIKEKKGRKNRLQKKKKKRSSGNIRKKVNKRKKEYIAMVRKQRAYVKEMKKQGKISNEEFKNIRKKIRNKNFRSKAQLKEYIEELHR